MALSTDTSRVVYQGNGTSAVFAFPYEFHNPTDISVFAYNSSAVGAGIITPFTLNGAGGYGFTISANANNAGIYPSGGSVVVNSAPNAQTKIIIFQSSALVNDFLIQQNGTIPSSALNLQLNYMTLLMQRLNDQTTRSVRLPDGYPQPFDTSIPANLAASAGKRLIVNSTATGWTFDETLGSYIPNSLIYAESNSSITSVPGAPAGYVMISGGSSAPSWGRLNFGSSIQYLGVLPISNGGTGNTSFVQNALVFMESPTQFGTIAQDTVGFVLTSNGSSAPTFQAFSAALINSGTILPAFGGTGWNGPVVPGAVVVGSAATQMAMTSVGLTDVPLVGNTGEIPSFRALPLTSGSSVTGTLPTARGGTGFGGSYTARGVIYASSTTQMAATGAGGQDVPLVGTAGGAPQFAPLNLASGSSTTGALPFAAGGTGQTSSTGALQALLPSQTGNNGYVLTTNGSSASWSASPSAVTYKNYAQNADFRFFQRMNPSTLTAVADTGFGADRWQMLVSSGAISVNRNVSNNVSSYSPYDITVMAQGGSSVWFGMVQKLENARTSELRGKQVTFSFWAKQGVGNMSSVRAALVYNNGTADTFPTDIVSTWGATPTLAGSCAYVASGTDVAIGSSWAQYSATMTVGTTFNNLALFIWTGSSQVVNNEFRISQVQLVRGASAIGWEYLSKPYEQDLAECQRFYEKSYQVDTVPGSNSTLTPFAFSMGVVSAPGGWNGLATVPFKAPKRTSAYSTDYWDETGNQTKYSWFDASATTTHNASLSGTNVNAGQWGMRWQVVLPQNAVSVWWHWAAYNEL